MAASEFVIEARNLVKIYGERVVVKGIDLQISTGECFGILGPNGAGKSSALRMMYCASPTTSGKLSVLGLNPNVQGRILKGRIGIVPQDDNLDSDFTVFDNLYLYAIYHSIGSKEARGRIEELLDLMKLQDHRDFKIDQLSGGLRRRVTLARALINSPQLLFLDEPTTGLDPNARIWIWDLLQELKQQGRTLIITTHYMEEAEQICDRVAIMDHGKILSIGTPRELIAAKVGSEVIEFKFVPAELDYLIKRIDGRYDYQVLKTKMNLFLKPGQSSKESIEMLPNKHVVIRPASLGDVFLKIAGYDLRD